MTLFMASVRNADEAGTALANGADIIAAKDSPRGGMPGVLPLMNLMQIVACIAGRCPVGAVLEDVQMCASHVSEAATAMLECGPTFLGLGLFPSPSAPRCIEALAKAVPTMKKFGIMFADLGVDRLLLEPMAAAGFDGIMIDTADKDVGGLLDHLGLAKLAALADHVHSVGLQVGLAGGLEMPDVSRLLALRPDVLGFRRALCGREGRAGRIGAEQVRTVRELIPPRRKTGADQAKVDDALEVRFGTPKSHSGARVLDRIFVRDLVVAMRIGAYAAEHDRTQRVRFNVDAEIEPAEHLPSDMRDVVSYDVIVDGIQLIAAREHIALVETVAERVAQLALTMPRVARVIVRVEKLDVHACSVGVEIVREN